MVSNKSGLAHECRRPRGAIGTIPSALALSANLSAAGHGTDTGTAAERSASDAGRSDARVAALRELGLEFARQYQFSSRS